MYQFTSEIEIKAPLDQVVRTFSNRDLIPVWQPGLLSIETIETSPYPKYKLRFASGRRKVIMTETIIDDRLPEHYECTYQMKGLANRVIHRFEALPGGHTRWICTNEFRFKGLMRLVAVFMKEGLEQQTRILMKNFTGFVASRVSERNKDGG